MPIYGIFLFLVFHTHISLGGVDFLFDSAKPLDFTNLVTNVLKTKEWKKESAELSDFLTKAYSEQAVQKEQWKYLSGIQQWCELFEKNPRQAGSLTPETLQWLMGDFSLTEDFFANLDPKDNLPNVLSLLQEFHQAEPKRFPAYNRLALAIALVWDVKSLPVPHRQVDPTKIKPDPSTPLQKFQFWVDSNVKKMTDYDLTKLEADQLKFVVNATVNLDELAWAQKNVRYTRTTFENAFFVIKYDQGRIDKGIYDWPYQNYDLATIKKVGGICTDQAYFAAMAGKASGIPTLYFEGEGRRGGHAWFGYMKNNDRWNMDCGRYRYDKYAVGTARDPQTGLEISDHEVAFLAESFHNTPAHRNSMMHLRQGKIFQIAGETAKALAAAETAIKLSPQSVDAWDFKTELLGADTHAGVAYKAHLNVMLNHFGRHADVRLACQRKLLAYAQKTGDEQTAKQIEDRMIRDNLNNRSDLSAEIYSEKILGLCDKGDWKTARTTVQDGIVKLKEDEGTAMKLLRLYVNLCLKGDRPDDALAVVTYFKGRIRVSPLETSEFEFLQASVKDAVQKKKTAKP